MAAPAAREQPRVACDLGEHEHRGEERERRREAIERVAHVVEPDESGHDHEHRGGHRRPTGPGTRPHATSAQHRDQHDQAPRGPHGSALPNRCARQDSDDRPPLVQCAGRGARRRSARSHARARGDPARSRVPLPRPDGRRARPPRSATSWWVRSATRPRSPAVARDATVVTYEWEGVPADAARFLAADLPVHPGARSLEVSQDRLTEKETFRRLGIATPAFAAVDDRAGLDRGGRRGRRTAGGAQDPPRRLRRQGPARAARRRRPRRRVGRRSATCR